MVQQTHAETQSTLPAALISTGILQRKCACGQHTGGGGECAECRKKRAGTLQRAAVNPALVNEVLPIVHEVLRSPGQPLDAATRTFMEPRFGYDFSQVRVHTDNKAAESARAVNALAYTVGRDVVFGGGQYTMGTIEGRRLLAHELTHVVQQGGNPSLQARLSLSDCDGVTEREAETVATALSSDYLPKIQERTTPPALWRVCGPTAIGTTVSSCTGLSGDIAGTTFLFVVACDDFRTDTPPRGPGVSAGEEAALRAFAASITTGDTIEVHGFASEEGDPIFNDNLSCARATKALGVLSSELTRAGKTATFRLFRHGATAGPREDRRSVVIRIITPSAPTPRPEEPGFSFTPCATLPFHLGSRGGCGSGTDFTYHDFPPLSSGDSLIVAPFRVQPDATLLGTFTAELGGLAGSEGRDAIRQFSSGTGTKRTHGAGSTLATMTERSGALGTALSAVRSEINSQITSQAVGGVVECSRLNIPPASMPAISFGFSDGATLKAVIGGTQGLDIYVLSFSLNPSTRTYTMQLRFVICDDFGVDHHDLYSPGLISFWVLQHERAGYQPFINEIIVEPTFTDSF